MLRSLVEHLLMCFFNVSRFQIVGKKKLFLSSRLVEFLEPWRQVLVMSKNIATICLFSHVKIIEFDGFRIEGHFQNADNLPITLPHLTLNAPNPSGHRHGHSEQCSAGGEQKCNCNKTRNSTFQEHHHFSLFFGSLIFHWGNTMHQQNGLSATSFCLLQTTFGPFNAEDANCLLQVGTTTKRENVLQKSCRRWPRYTHTHHYHHHHHPSPTHTTHHHNSTHNLSAQNKKEETALFSFQIRQWDRCPSTVGQQIHSD